MDKEVIRLAQGFNTTRLIIHDTRLLKKRYHLDVNLSEKIGCAVWNQMNSKDIRDALKIAKLTKSSSDVDWLVDNQMKYGKKELSRIDTDHIFVNH